MTRPTRTMKNDVLTLDTGTEEALRSAVGAATMLGPNKAQGLLELPDEQLGHLLKVGISQVLDIAARVTFGRASPASRVAKTATRPAKESTALPTSAADTFDFDRRALAERRALVADGKLLPAAETWVGLDITRQALTKAVAAGRIFTVDVGATPYYPAFYLTGDIDRKTLGKVTQHLGTLPGWSKWQFFTTPKASLGNVTPLDALASGKVEQVERAAAAFVQR